MQRARTMLRDVLDTICLETSLSHDATDPAVAEEPRFGGSPTIRVDGIDVVRSARTSVGGGDPALGRPTRRHPALTDLGSACCCRVCVLHHSGDASSVPILWRPRPKMRESSMTSVGESTAARIDGTRAIILGIAGGLVGGVIFGAMMAMQSMLPMVASLVGSEDALIGFVVHLAISAGAGLVFGLAISAVPTLIATPVAAVVAGAVYGAIWWVGGALIAMPLMLGMGEMVLGINDTAIMSLIGHLAFGVATALVVYALARRA
jgi:hypothetical protein